MDFPTDTGSLYSPYGVLGFGADIGTCLACFVIHIALLNFIICRPDIPFRNFIRSLSLLAILSGIVQGFEIACHWWTVGPLITVLKLITVCVLMTVCTHLYTLREVLMVLKNPLQLEEEIRKFQTIESKLQLEIDRRVQLEKDLSSSNNNLNSQLIYRAQLEAKLREIEARYRPDQEHSLATQSAVDRLDVVNKTLSAMEPG